MINNCVELFKTGYQYKLTDKKIFINNKISDEDGNQNKINKEDENNENGRNNKEDIRNENSEHMIRKQEGRTFNIIKNKNNNSRIHTMYNKFKLKFEEKTLQIIKESNRYCGKYMRKELKNEDLLLEFDNFYKIAEINGNCVIQILYEFQLYKEKTALIQRNKVLHDILYFNRQEIVMNELNKIKDGCNKGELIGVIKYILKMSKYFLICFYFNLGMDYSIITYVETCFVTMKLFEFIFGVIETYNILKNNKIFQIKLFKEKIIFIKSLYEDDQIKEMQNYQEKIDMFLLGLF